MEESDENLEEIIAEQEATLADELEGLEEVTKEDSTVDESIKEIIAEQEEVLEEEETKVNNADGKEKNTEEEREPGHIENDPTEEDIDPLKSLAIVAKDLPDHFVPLTSEERVALKEKLKKTAMDTVVSLLISANPVPEKNGFLSHRTFKMNPNSSKQFMHMHHMKTGGTSMDNLIHCAISRQLKVNNNTKVEYSSMSECGSGVRNCMSQLAKELNASVIDNIFYYNDNDGNPIMDAPFDPAVGESEAQVGDLNICRTSDCGVMSYCASLHTVRTFGWKDVGEMNYP